MEESSIVNWLKKIFSVQSLALIIAAITLLITWKQLYYTTSSDVQLRLDSAQGCVNVTNVEQCLIYKYDYGGAPNCRHLIPVKYYLPYIVNDNNRSVKNLAISLKLDAQNCYFTDLNGDSIALNMQKDYVWEFSTLAAYMNKPLPISHIVLTNNDFTTFDMWLTVSYDGIEKPISYHSYVEIWPLGADYGKSNDYIEWRNLVFDDINKKFSDVELTNNEYCVVIGDTIIPSINNLHVFRKESPIKSLNEIAPYIPWYEPILTLLLFIYLLYCIRIVKFMPLVIFSIYKNWWKIRKFKIPTFIVGIADELVAIKCLSKFEAYLVTIIGIPSVILLITVIIYLSVNSIVR